jgi:hypothetical protein
MKLQPGPYVLHCLQAYRGNCYVALQESRWLGSHLVGWCWRTRRRWSRRAIRSCSGKTRHRRRETFRLDRSWLLRHLCWPMKRWGGESFAPGKIDDAHPDILLEYVMAGSRILTEAIKRRSNRSHCCFMKLSCGNS